MVFSLSISPQPLGQQHQPTRSDKTIATSKPAAQDAQQIFKQVSPSLFILDLVNEKGEAQVSSASAVAVAPSTVLTTLHNSVVKLALRQQGSLRLRQGAKTWPVTVLRADREHGLCLLEADGLEAPVPPVRPSSSLKRAERVYLVGLQIEIGVEKAPGEEIGFLITEHGLAVSEGTIHALSPYEKASVLETTAKVSLGSDGGGLFDSQGQLVGLMDLILFIGERNSYAMPTEWFVRTDSWAAPLGILADKPCPRWHTVAWKEIGLRRASWDSEGARTAYENATRCAPDDDWAWVGLGFTRGLLKEYESAVAAYEEAVQLDSSLASAWSGLGDAYVGLGQDAKAIEAYETAVKHSPKDFRVWRQMWLAYKRLGQVEKAMLAYEQADRLESDPVNDEAPLRAMIVKANPQDAEAWYALGQAHARMKRFREAVQAYRESIRLNPLNYAVWLDSGAAYTELEEHGKAAEAYEQSVRLKPAAGSWFALGGAYRDLKLWQRAAEAFGESLRLNPQSLASWFFVGEAYCKQGNSKGMVEVHDRLRILSPSTAEVFFREVIQKSSAKCEDGPRNSPKQ